APARSKAVAAAHPLSATAAAATAAPASARSPWATCPISAPVTGLVAGSYWPDRGGCQRPSTKRSTVRGGCGVIGVPSGVADGADSANGRAARRGRHDQSRHRPLAGFPLRLTL